MVTDTVSFELVGDELGKDVESALKTAFAGGAVFRNTDPLSIFHEALDASIRDIESDPRGRLFQEFLLKGPYIDRGAIPPKLRHQYLSDEKTASVITFIYSHMVNCFKGALTELLASAPCLNVLEQIQQSGGLPRDTRLYVGDVVGVSRLRGKGFAKGADLHMLIENHKQDATPRVTVAGVVEVKSYFQSQNNLRAQLDKHLLRAKGGLRVSDIDYFPEHISIGYGKNRKVMRLTVLADNWKLPRTFHFEPTEHGRLLQIDRGSPSQRADRILRTGENEWLITLRWSKEALAAAAYEMTFWYMEKVGEVIYSHGVPKDWAKQMAPAEAGRNAAKMMLYYAILRCRNPLEEQRAIALYNSYGFGYALGMNFRNAKGQREMLWPQDLDEISDLGRTKCGCSIVK